MLKVQLNRIAGMVALPSLRPDNVLVDGDEAIIKLQLSVNHDIELYFPAPGGAARIEYLELVRDVLTHLSDMDNDVQRLCAEQSARSSLHSRNYEGELAFITFTDPDTVVLRYFGTKVNTEWDEPFTRTQGKWELVKSDEDGAAANGGTGKG